MQGHGRVLTDGDQLRGNQSDGERLKSACSIACLSSGHSSACHVTILSIAYLPANSVGFYLPRVQSL
jgi:hypothetical protein